MAANNAKGWGLATGLALLLLLEIPTSWARPLVVGVCDPGFSPFVMRDAATGQLTGHDVTLWSAVYRQATITAAATGDEEVISFFPYDDPPPLIGLGFSDLIGSIKNGTVDIGLCGIYETPDRTDSMDFLSPYLTSGIRAMVRKVRLDMDSAGLLELIIVAPNPRATLALLCLCASAIVYAHLMWVLENDPNPGISPTYFKGVWDAFWLSIVTATTVGYGDKAPVTYAGKLLTILWMLMGTFFLLLYAGSLTTQLFEDRTADHHPEGLDVSDLRVLMRHTVAVSFESAAEALAAMVPGASFRFYDSQKESLDALARGDVNVALEDAWQAEYVKVDQDYRGVLTVSGNLFWQMDSCIAVSRPGGNEHPVRDVLASALLQHMRGAGRLNFQSGKKHWFGEQLSSATLSSEEYNEQVDSMVTAFNNSFSYALAAVVAVWCCLAVFSNRARIIARERRHYLRHKLGIRADMSAVQLQKVLRKCYRDWCAEMSVSTMTWGMLLRKLSSLRQSVTAKDIQRMLEDFEIEKKKGSDEFDFRRKGEIHRPGSRMGTHIDMLMKAKSALFNWKSTQSVTGSGSGFVRPQPEEPCPTDSPKPSLTAGRDRTAAASPPSSLANSRRNVLVGIADWVEKGKDASGETAENGEGDDQVACGLESKESRSQWGLPSGSPRGAARRTSEGLMGMMRSSTPLGLGGGNSLKSEKDSLEERTLPVSEFILVMEALITPEYWELHKLESNAAAVKGDLAEMRHALMTDISAMQRKIMTEVQNVPALVHQERKAHIGMEQGVFDHWRIVARLLAATRRGYEEAQRKAGEGGTSTTTPSRPQKTMTRSSSLLGFAFSDVTRRAGPQAQKSDSLPARIGPAPVPEDADGPGNVLVVKVEGPANYGLA